MQSDVCIVYWVDHALSRKDVDIQSFGGGIIQKRKNELWVFPRKWLQKYAKVFFFFLNFLLLWSMGDNHEPKYCLKILKRKSHMPNNSLFLICIFIILLDHWEKNHCFLVLIILLFMGRKLYLKIMRPNDS